MLLPNFRSSPTATNIYNALSAEPSYHPAAFEILSPVALFYSAVARLVFWAIGARPKAIAESTDLAKHSRKVAIVTGSNTGIGYETAKSLVLNHGMDVILACRSRDKAMMAIDSINQANKNGGRAIFMDPLDLSNWDSIQQFVSSFASQYGELHVLINNAGRNTSGQNGRLDLLFQSNFLGHVLLTQLLMDHLIRGKGRIVNLSSVMHHFCAPSLHMHSPEYWKNCALYGQPPHSTYSQSKLAAVLFTFELHRRYADQGITAVTANPGAVNSDIWRGFPRWIIPLFRLLYLTPAQGCTTSVAAAVDLSLHGGDYLQPYWLPSSRNRNRPPFPIFEMLGPFVGYQVTTPRLPGRVQLAAEALWSASEELANCHFPVYSSDETSD